ncbi:hypothetical protein Tco_1394084 [Tanacetum coccineum]
MHLSLRSLEQLCFLTDHSGCWIEVEEVEAIKTTQKLQKILKFQMYLLVVKEEVADEVETRVVFSVNHVSFSSFFVLQPNQLGASQCDHGPLTSPELRTTSCNLHELCRSWFPTFIGEESLSYETCDCLNSPSGGRGRVVIVFVIVVAVRVVVMVAGSG